ncbi:SH3 domain-containing protein [Bacillus sp. DJP31]|uniref:SH3 domain-containing protein n=1 Tax=Bacillus sp. DJP31 TaxID=3409789 RepID=UPI003BB50A36
MKKAVIFILVLSLLSLSIPHSSIFAENITVVIKADSLNVRSGAGLSYRVVASVMKDQSFEVLEKNGDWVKIKVSSSLSGWVASWLVSEKSPSKTQKTVAIVQKPGNMEATTNGLRIRKGPGTSFQVIGSVNIGNLLQFNERSEDWIKITFKQLEGWVHSDYLTGIPSEDNENTDKNKVQKSGIVTTNSLNVRDSASLNGPIIGKVTKDEKVDILSEKSDWYEVRLKPRNGWVHKDYIKISSAIDTEKRNDPAPSQGSQPNQMATVTATILNIRSDYSLNGAIVFTVKKGDQLTIVAEENSWYKIKLSNGKEGWVAGWYLEKTTNRTAPTDSSNAKTSTVTILYDTTNIRSGPSTKNDVVQRTMQGDSFTIVEKIDDWYKIALSTNTFGYVAGWLVSTTGEVQKVERPGMNQYLSGKTIVIDPGHGGRDSGAKGVRGTFEKTLTLRTAKLLDEKLRAAGAKSVLTRSQDAYVSLNSRVSFAHYYQADAFLSLHYDSSIYPSANGTTTYYYNKTKDYSLGQSIQSEMIKQTSLSDRGVNYSNFHVLRQNKRPSVLLELGFLSNISEEAHVSTSQYQEKVTTAIFNGLAQEFKK